MSVITQAAKKRAGRTIDFGMIVVTVVAALLRCWHTGDYQIRWDEVNLLFWSLRVARFGDWIWASNNPFSGFVQALSIHNHSPVANYLLALPYLFSPNPIAVRLAVGLLGAAAVVVIYLMMRRYFGSVAALATGLLMACGVAPVEWSRFIWNPNVASLFIALWMYTGLLGYWEGKRWAVVVHWVMLAIAVQCHPGNVLLGVPSLFLLGMAFYRRETRTRRLARATAIGWLLAALTFVPWAIGIVQINQGTSNLMNGVSDTAASEDTQPAQARTALDLANIPASFARITAGTDYQTIARGGQQSPGNWFPPLSLDTILMLGALAIFCATIVLVVIALRDPTHYLFLIFFSLIALFPLIAGNLLLPGRVQDFYVGALIFGAFPALGIVIAFFVRRNRLLGLALLIGCLLLVGIQAWLNVAYLRWLELDGWQYPLRGTMDTFRDYVADWTSDGRDAVFVIDSSAVSQYETFDAQRYFWTVVGQGYPLRVTNQFEGGGIPLAAAHPTTVVSLTSGTTLPAVFGSIQRFGQAHMETEPVFQKVTISANDLPAPNYLPVAAARFDNSAHILGIVASTPPQAAGIWSAVLQWHIDLGIPQSDYQFSVRLVGDDDHVYGQKDFRSLDRDLWRTGDTVLSPLALPVNEDIPPGTPLRVQILMYTYPQMQNANVLDDSGGIVGQWLYLEPTSAPPIP